MPSGRFEPGFTNAYVGVPFLSHGRDREGWDCWGLLRVFYEEQFGIRLPSYDESYQDALTDESNIQRVFQREREQWVPIEAPEIGDAIWMRIVGHEMHVGVWCGPDRMLHTIDGIGSHIQRLDSPSWRKRILSFYRHRLRPR